MNLELTSGDLFGFDVKFTVHSTGAPIDVYTYSFVALIYDANGFTVSSFTCTNGGPGTGIVSISGGPALLNWNGLKWRFRNNSLSKTFLTGRVQVA
jgi:hypothetical protein